MAGYCRMHTAYIAVASYILLVCIMHILLVAKLSYLIIRVVHDREIPTIRLDVLPNDSMNDTSTVWRITYMCLIDN